MTVWVQDGARWCTHKIVFRETPCSSASVMNHGALTTPTGLSDR